MRPGAECVQTSDLLSALKDAPNPRDGRVVAAKLGDGLMVRAVWPDGQSLERRVPVDASECAAVRRVVLALLRTWLAAPPAPLATPPVPVPAPKPKPKPVSSPSEAEGRVERVEPISAPPIVAAEPEEEEEPMDVRESLAGAQPAPPEPDWRFGLGALGGVTAGTTSEGVFAGSAYVEALRRQTLGIGVEGGLETSRATTVAWASARWVTLYARLKLGLTERVAFVTTLGARLWVTEVGAPRLNPRLLVGGGAALTAGVAVDLGPVALLVHAVGSARLPEERIAIEGNKALFLRWWQVGAMLGLGWNFP